MSSDYTKMQEPDASFAPVRVSFYFAQEDQDFYKKDLSPHLAALERNERIHMWNEQQIQAGQGRKQVLYNHLSTDRVLILLVSAYFLASDFWEQHEQRILQRQQSGDAIVIPILVRPCSLEGTGLETLQALPREFHLSSSWMLTDEVWKEVATEISQVIESIQPWAFVICALEDTEYVEHLNRDLAPSNVRLFSDPVQKGDIRETMRGTPIVLLVVSPRTAGSSVVKDQMNVVADYRRPVFIVWIEGNDEQRPYRENWHAEAVFDARAERYETALFNLVGHLKQRGRTVSTAHPDRFLPKGPPRNPYKGLRAFTEKDANDFFGREALIDELVNTVKHILVASSISERPSRLLTVLLGASGSGKSSLVMAGLLPFLQQKGLASKQGDSDELDRLNDLSVLHSQNWIYLDRIVPGKNPLNELASVFAQQPAFLNKYNRLTLQHELATSDSLLVLDQLARELAGNYSSRKVVLFIDQFEEVFTSTSPSERSRFFEILKVAVTEPGGPLLVLLTLRADFYDRPMAYGDLYELLEAHRVSVLPMKREELRRIVEEPAQLEDVQLSFEGDLVGDLLFDVRDQDASLPLLQFTLDQLFRHRDGHRLTLQAYREIGGVKGALVKHAEETYARLPLGEHQKLAQVLFMRLLNTDDAQQDVTRRRALLSEFDLSDSRQKKLLDETREIFINARLLTTNQVAEKVTIEVAHEALIREWPRCIEWINDDRMNFPFRQALSKNVAQWEQLKEAKELLYRGSQLKAVKKKINQTLLSQQEKHFIQVSTVNQRLQWIRMVALLLLPVIVLGLAVTPVLVFRPSWCPPWLCPAPQVKILLDKGGTHDNNLQVTFQITQSSFKILTVAPSDYTPGTPLPNDAQLISTSQKLPYRVVLKIHSLQQGRFGLAIDDVRLLINKQAQEIPYPLRVADNYTLIYNNNLYQVTYRGQQSGIKLDALYMPVSQGFVSLDPGETDEISLEVRSTVVADLHFQVQVAYHVITELASHTLTLPNIFEITFSDKTNWHPYQIQNGTLVAAS